MLGLLIGAEHIEVEVNAAPAPGELTSGRGVDKKQLGGECPSQRKAICASVSRRSDLVVVSGNLPFRKSMWILKRKGTYRLEEGCSLCRQKSPLCSQRKQGGSWDCKKPGEAQFRTKRSLSGGRGLASSCLPFELAVYLGCPTRPCKCIVRGVISLLQAGGMSHL